LTRVITNWNSHIIVFYFLFSHSQPIGDRIQSEEAVSLVQGEVSKLRPRLA